MNAHTALAAPSWGDRVGAATTLLTAPFPLLLLGLITGAAAVAAYWERGGRR